MAGRPLFRLCLAATVIAALACGAPPATEHREAAVPRPFLGEAAPEVRALLDELAERVEIRLSDPATEDAALAVAFGELGEGYHAHELLDAARRCYAEAARLEPSSARWPYLAGRLERLAGRLEAAITSLSEAVERDPGLVAVQVALGEALLDAGRPEEADRAFTRALALDPGCAPALAGRAEVALLRGAPEEAVEELRPALAAQPAADALHHALGQAYRLLGDAERSAVHRRLAGRRRPSLEDPWMERVADLRTGVHNRMTEAQRLVFEGRLREAEGVYREVIGAVPDHHRAWLNLGSVLAHRGEPAAAEVAFRRALELAPGDPRATFNLGTVLLARGDLAEATALLEAAVATSPRNASARLNLGQAYRRSGKHREASAELEAVLEIDPSSVPAHLWRALQRLRLGDPHGARAALEESHRLLSRGSPEGAAASWPIAHALARLLAVCPDPSVRDGRRALELALAVHAAIPSVEHLRTVAMAYAETGRFGLAVRWQERALAEARAGGRRTSGTAEIEEELASYRAGRPWRLAWWYPPAEAIP